MNGVTGGISAAATVIVISSPHERIIPEGRTTDVIRDVPAGRPMIAGRCRLNTTSQPHLRPLSCKKVTASESTRTLLQICLQSGLPTNRVNTRKCRRGHA